MSLIRSASPEALLLHSRLRPLRGSRWARHARVLFWGVVAILGALSVLALLQAVYQPPSPVFHFYLG